MYFPFCLQSYKTQQIERARRELVILIITNYFQKKRLNQVLFLRDTFLSPSDQILELFLFFFTFLSVDLLKHYLLLCILRQARFDFFSYSFQGFFWSQHQAAYLNVTIPAFRISLVKGMFIAILNIGMYSIMITNCFWFIIEGYNYEYACVRPVFCPYYFSRNQIRYALFYNIVSKKIGILDFFFELSQQSRKNKKLLCYNNKSNNRLTRCNFIPSTFARKCDGVFYGTYFWCIKSWFIRVVCSMLSFNIQIYIRFQFIVAIQTSRIVVSKKNCLFLMSLFRFIALLYLPIGFMVVATQNFVMFEGLVFFFVK
eukprot:TRINITY_DN2937_c0_g1_i1.p2 TRINITY_DN2937_c0_g1~~TRINITY_DN2937_c0_g1_i1.p2  ORF type:complete len:313 (+),score=-7.81 TRINITY_DN2937_c0_g1_i1:261-1199(+)